MGHLKEKERTQYRKGRIGFVFQSFNLIDELTVEENVELQLKYLKVSRVGVCGLCMLYRKHL